MLLISYSSRALVFENTILLFLSKLSVKKNVKLYYCLMSFITCDCFRETTFKR